MAYQPPNLSDDDIEQIKKRFASIARLSPPDPTVPTGPGYTMPTPDSPTARRPMDERLPSGQTIPDAMAGIKMPTVPQTEMAMKSGQVQLPTVTPPVMPNVPDVPQAPENFGYNSDTQEMKDQRAYDLNRPPTLPEAESEYNRILNSKEHPNKFLSGLYLALQAIPKVFNQNNQTPIESLADARKANKLGASGQLVKTLQDQQKFQTDDDYKQSVAAYNRTKPEKDAALTRDRERRTGVLTANVQRKLDDDFIKNNPVYDPANPTPAQVAQLEHIGRAAEDFDAYDHSKTPTIKRFGDSVVTYDPTTKTWVDAGIDAHKDDPLVEVTLKNPAGGTESLKVRTSKKADILAGFQKEGMQIAASNTRQSNQQGFTADQNEKNRQLRVQLQDNAQKYGKDQTIQKASDAFKRLYFKANGKNPTQTEIDQFINSEIIPNVTGEIGVGEPTQ